MVEDTTERAPAVDDRVLRWLNAHERAVLWAAAGFQLVVLVAMIVLRMLPLLAGDTIRLKVVPIDPRDPMRGDYVILGYEISRVPEGGIEGLPQASEGPWPRWDRDEWLDERTVYVSLEPDADGRHWHGVRASVKKPSAGKFIRGKYVREGGGAPIRFGIEAYYVQEGAGKTLEEARNAKHLTAEIALMPSGKAALRELIVEMPGP